jgi:serine/threonine protein phosphatase 1
MLMDALRKAEFNPTQDRLFSVGDLTDRGPESGLVKSFLDSMSGGCRGNHCQMIIDVLKNSEGGRNIDFGAHIFRRNGIEWLADQTEDWRNDLAQKLAANPIAIEIETERGTVGLIHAGVPQGMAWHDMVNRLCAPFPDQKFIETLLWTRDRINDHDESGVMGIGRVFVGHTPVGAPTRLGNVYFVDTGAVFGVKAGDPNRGRMTAADLACCTQAFDQMVADPVSSDPQLFQAITTKPAKPRPFGQYARPSH